MSRSTLDHLRTFVTVYRTGSVTGAARLLGISQATASAHVHALEASLGHALFHRDRDGVTPTGRATELAREVASHVDAIEDATLLFGQSARPPRAIRIGGAAEILSAMVVPHLAEIMDAVGAPVLLEFGLAEDLLNMLEDGSLDIVVSSIPPRRRGISSAPLYDEEFLLVAAPTWSDVDVEAVPVIAYAENLPIIRRYWRSVFGRPPERLRLVAVIPDLRVIRTLLLAGIGMSVLPSYLVAGDLDAGALVSLDTPEVAPLNTVFLATRTRESASNATVGVAVAQLRRLIR